MTRKKGQISYGKIFKKINKKDNKNEIMVYFWTE